MYFKESFPHLYNSLLNFSVGRLDFTLKVIEDIYFQPNRPIGYIWRDSLAFTLKLLKRKNCFYKWQVPQEDCLTCGNLKCSLYIYRYFSRGFDKPKPFIFFHQNYKPSYKRGDKFTLSLYLIADAIDEAPHFINAIKLIGINETWQSAKGSYTVEEVVDSEYIEFQDFIKYEPVKEILLEILTPMKLVSDKEGIRYKGFQANLFLRLLINRVINLNYLYNSYTEQYEEQIKEEKKNLIDKVEEISSKGYTEWKDNIRFTLTQGKIKVGGLDGVILLHGDVDKFYPFLKIGEYIGVGSNTVSGYGRYKIHQIKTENEAY